MLVWTKSSGGLLYQRGDSEHITNQWQQLLGRFPDESPNLHILRGIYQNFLRKRNDNYLFYSAIKSVYNMTIDFYRTFAILVKSLHFIDLTWILEWKSSVKLSIMTKRRQRQGFSL